MEVEFWDKEYEQADPDRAARIRGMWTRFGEFIGADLIIYKDSHKSESVHIIKDGEPKQHLELSTNSTSIDGAWFNIRGPLNLPDPE